MLPSISDAHILLDNAAILLRHVRKQPLSEKDRKVLAEILLLADILQRTALRLVIMDDVLSALSCDSLESKH